jgi:tryptophan synthase alpha chain
MTYYNPIFKYGLEKFVDDCVAAGVDGIIVPDLPPDEAEEIIKLSSDRPFDTIFLLAPTSTDLRIKKVSSASKGFIYYVSMTGITGSKLTIDPATREHFEKIRTVSKKPIAVGFGVSTPDEAALISGFADGVIVGSAIVKKISSTDSEIRAYLRSLRDAIK